MKEESKEDGISKSTIAFIILIGILALIFSIALIGFLIWVIVRIFDNFGTDTWAVVIALTCLVLLVLLLHRTKDSSKNKISTFNLVSLLILIIIAVVFFRYVIIKRYQCDQLGSLVALYVGSIILSVGLIFYSFGGDFSIFDVIQ